MPITMVDKIKETLKATAQPEHIKTEMMENKLRTSRLLVFNVKNEKNKPSDIPNTNAPPMSKSYEKRCPLH